MKFKVEKNAWDNWYGYSGTRKVIEFQNKPEQSMEDEAKDWLALHLKGVEKEYPCCRCTGCKVLRGRKESALFPMSKPSYEELVKVLRKVEEAPNIEYGQGDDDPGACIHCGQVSYKDHRDGCLVLEVKKLLERCGK